MLPEITILFFLGVVILLAGEERRNGLRKYVIIATIALLQTALVVVEMFLMKPPRT